MSLRDALARVPDPRARRGVRYPFIELLHLIVCAVISGARTLTMITEWTQDAASSAPVFEQGRLPSLATIHRVAAGIGNSKLIWPRVSRLIWPHPGYGVSRLPLGAAGYPFCACLVVLSR